MLRTLRRLVYLALLGASGYAAYTMWARRGTSTAPTAEPSWPPLQASPADEEPAAVAEPHFVQIASEPGDPAGTPAGEQRWVAAEDGRCPDGYPIKANDNSRIFHVPGGRDYERTAPERCYATEADAEADGYRRAKS